MVSTPDPPSTLQEEGGVWVRDGGSGYETEGLGTRRRVWVRGGGSGFETEGLGTRLMAILYLTMHEYGTCTSCTALNFSSNTLPPVAMLLLVRLH